MYDKILLPMDGSDTSKKAIEYVKDFADKFNSTIIVLFSYEVTDKITETVANIDKDLKHHLEDMETNINNYAQKLLNEVEKELNYKVIKKVVKGNAGKKIVQTADEESCDIIIMSSRGLNALETTLLGSTSNYVVHHTECPIFIVH